MHVKGILLVTSINAVMSPEKSMTPRDFYWCEGDHVLIHLGGKYIGVLDCWFRWPTRQYHGPRIFGTEGKHWPVNINDYVVHRYFPVEPVDVRDLSSHIIENVTLNNHVSRIQRQWRVYWSKKRNAAATLIQTTFRKCISDPYHMMCRARLLCEYECMKLEI